MNFDRDKTFSCTITDSEIDPDFLDLMIKQAEELRKRQEYFEKHLFIVGSEEVKRQLEEEIPGIKVIYDRSNTISSNEIWIMAKATFDIDESFGYNFDSPEFPSDEELMESINEIDKAIEDWYSNGDD